MSVKVKLIENFVRCPKVNSLSVGARDFLMRLKFECDNLGRIENDVSLLRSVLYPRIPDTRITDISRWLAECHKAGLIRCYVDGQRRPVTEIYGAKQRLTKGMTSEFGPYEDQSHLPLDESLSPGRSGKGSGDDPPPKKITDVPNRIEVNRKQEREEQLSPGIQTDFSKNNNEKEDLAIAKACRRGIPEEFSKCCYAEWLLNNGHNALGIKKTFDTYVSGRWMREKKDWEDGSHSFKSLIGKASKPTEDEGPTLGQVKEYAKSKGDVYAAFGVSWWQAWNQRKWRNNAGHLIDWQLEFQKAWGKRRESGE